MPLHIEFVGLPGTGKSTVRHLVVRRLKQQGIRSVPDEQESLRAIEPRAVAPGAPRRRRPSGERRLLYLRQHLRMRRLAAAAYSYLLRDGSVTRNRLRMVRTLLYTLDRIRGISADAARRGVDVVIYDQGFAAYLRQMMGEETPAGARRWKRLVTALREALPRVPYLAVVIELEPSKAVARVQGRAANLGRWDRLSPGEALAELTPQYHRLGRLMQSLEEAGVFQGTLRLDGNRSPDDLADEITAYIRAMIPATTPVVRGPQLNTSSS